MDSDRYGLALLAMVAPLAVPAIGWPRRRLSPKVNHEYTANATH